MSKPKVILFAGPIGSSKTPIAYYLSWNLGLPIFNRDTIRNEVREDVGTLDVEEFERRSRARLNRLLESNMDFILDASIDRVFPKYQARFDEYNTFIISLDISKELLTKFWGFKGYDLSKGLESSYKDHQDFLEEYSDLADLSIIDDNFKNRLDLALEEVKNWYGV